MECWWWAAPSAASFEPQTLRRPNSPELSAALMAKESRHPSRPRLNSEISWFNRLTSSLFPCSGVSREMRMEDV